MRWHSQWQKKLVRPKTGLILSEFNVQIVLPLRYFRLQIVDISGNFCFQSIPISGCCIGSGLDVLVYFMDRFLGSSLRLRDACKDLSDCEDKLLGLPTAK